MAYMDWRATGIDGVDHAAVQSSRVGRFAGSTSFALMMIVLIVFTRKTLGSQSNVFREEIAKDPKGWLNQIRFAAYAIGVLVPVFLLVLTAIGYYYSAQQLAIRLQSTLIMSFSVLLVHAIISRWFVVKRKRLALRQTRERQQQQSMAENTSDGAPPTLPTAIKETDWAAVHERLRLLLRHAVSVLIGSWFIWSDVLPALRILDRVELWTKVTELTESYVGPEGTIVKSSRMEVEPTTLRRSWPSSACWLHNIGKERAGTAGNYAAKSLASGSRRAPRGLYGVALWCGTGGFAVCVPNVAHQLGKCAMVSSRYDRWPRFRIAGDLCEFCVGYDSAV